MKPSGTRVTASLWLIQHEAMSPRPSKSTPPTSPSVVLPNSAMPVRPDLAAEGLRHRLHAVTDAEHGDAELEDLGIDHRGAGLVDRRGAAREDDAERVAPPQLVDRGVVREDLREDAQLADPPGDQLRVLGTEVEDDQRPLGRLGLTCRPFDRPRLCLTHPTLRVAPFGRC